MWVDNCWSTLDEKETHLQTIEWVHEWGSVQTSNHISPTTVSDKINPAK